MKIEAAIEILDPDNPVPVTGYEVEKACYLAVTALKRELPCKPKKHNGGGDSVTWWYVCGDCGHAISPGENYCGNCGRKVDWDAAD